MAAPGSELAKILAKRRSAGEKVFEGGANSSFADAVAAPASCANPIHTLARVACASNDVRGAPAETAGSSPPWMAAIAEGGGCPGGAPSGAVPPWLAAAQECGVTFFDPEGKELEVPSSQVPAFKAGLEKIRDFERAWAARDTQKSCAKRPDDVEGERKPEVPPVDASGGSAAPRKMPSKPQASASAGVGDAVSGPSSSTAEQAPEVTQREDVKSFVQKRYFALLREGFDPTEAAVRAIKEVAGQRGESDCPASREATAPAADVGEPSARSSSPSSQQSCASSIKGDTQQGKHRSSKVISVVA